MLTTKHIALLFGFFLSMFYIFKYGNITPVHHPALCDTLNELQIDAAAEIGPLIRADDSETAFDDKVKKAVAEARKSVGYMNIQKEIYVTKSQLNGQVCPAPSLTQMVRLAANS